MVFYQAYLLSAKNPQARTFLPNHLREAERDALVSVRWEKVPERV